MRYFCVFLEKNTFFLAVVRVCLLVGDAFPEKRCAFKLCFQMWDWRKRSLWAFLHAQLTDWVLAFLLLQRPLARGENRPACEPFSLLVNCLLSTFFFSTVTARDERGTAAPPPHFLCLSIVFYRRFLFHSGRWDERGTAAPPPHFLCLSIVFSFCFAAARPP